MRCLSFLELKRISNNTSWRPVPKLLLKCWQQKTRQRLFQSCWHHRVLAPVRDEDCTWKNHKMETLQEYGWWFNPPAACRAKYWTPAVSVWMCVWKGVCKCLKVFECSVDCKSTTGYKYKSIYHHDDTFISITKINFIHKGTKGKMTHLKCKYQPLVE